MYHAGGNVRKNLREKKGGEFLLIISMEGKQVSAEASSMEKIKEFDGGFVFTTN